MTQEQLLRTIFMLPDADVASMQAFDAVALAAQQQVLLKEMAYALLNSSKMTIEVPKASAAIYYAGMQIGTLQVSAAGLEGGKQMYNYSLKLISNAELNRQVGFWKLLVLRKGQFAFEENAAIAVNYNSNTTSFAWRLASDDYDKLQLVYI